jgi:hypothetical protein
MAGQLVEIHATWDEPDFHCPACGEAIFLKEGSTDKPCPHLLFTYISEVGQYETVADAVKETLTSLVESEDDLPAPWDDRLLDILDDKDVVYSLHSTPPSGMTIAAGIRFASPTGGHVEPWSPQQPSRSQAEAHVETDDGGVRQRPVRAPLQEGPRRQLPAQGEEVTTEDALLEALVESFKTECCGCERRGYRHGVQMALESSGWPLGRVRRLFAKALVRVGLRVEEVDCVHRAKVAR